MAKAKTLSPAMVLLAGREQKVVVQLEKLAERYGAAIDKNGGIDVNASEHWAPAGTLVALPRNAQNIPAWNDATLLGYARSIVSKAERGEGIGGTGLLEPVSVAGYDETVVVDGQHRAGLFEFFAEQGVEGIAVPYVVRPEVTSEAVAESWARTLTYVRRNLTTADKKAGLEKDLVSYAAGKHKKTVAQMAEEHGVSEQTVRNRIKAMQNVAAEGEEAAKTVTVQSFIERLSKVPFPTPVPDVTVLQRLEAIELPDAFPVNTAINLYNVALGAIAMSGPLGVFLTHKKVRFDDDAGGIAIEPTTEEALEASKRNADTAEKVMEHLKAAATEGETEETEAEVVEA